MNRITIISLALAATIGTATAAKYHDAALYDLKGEVKSCKFTTTQPEGSAADDFLPYEGNFELNFTDDGRLSADGAGYVHDANGYVIIDDPEYAEVYKTNNYTYKDGRVTDFVTAGCSASYLYDKEGYLVAYQRVQSTVGQARFSYLPLKVDDRNNWTERIVVADLTSVTPLVMQSHYYDNVKTTWKETREITYWDGEAALPSIIIYEDAKSALKSRLERIYKEYYLFWESPEEAAGKPALKDFAPESPTMDERFLSSSLIALQELAADLDEKTGPDVNHWDNSNDGVTKKSFKIKKIEIESPVAATASVEVGGNFVRLHFCNEYSNHYGHRSWLVDNFYYESGFSEADHYLEVINTPEQ